MNDEHRAFLETLLTTPSPSGFETPGQRVWIDYVSEFADDVRTDEYGNAVAVVDGEGPEIAFGGHADQIGLIVSGIDENGFVRVDKIGGSDRAVTKGQHVEVHTDDGIVRGVVGQRAIHLRDPADDEFEDIVDQHVDIGAKSKDEAEELVDVGDPIVFSPTIEDLHGTRLAGPGIDNRVGTWVAAEALRRAAERDTDATVYAVSTVQEEVGLQGAKMVGFDLDPDAIVAVDVTHAMDSPDVTSEERFNDIDIELGDGPVVARGSTNHPEVVSAVREAGRETDIPVQLQAAGVRTGTDADAFYTARGGTPSLNIGLPNRYMHTPVEVIDTDDLEAAADLLAEFAVQASGRDGFSVDL
ncbi:M20/M25/M40 family metallo-hydrolase [Haladaptatus caseinilyticus]|uniref:M20/M25/M40 family metallo-hydrolase n=1 Tax=Haladaptatus caseinilyticus TaxID=2993314 RepID=UPI00224ACA8F|nr:M20/M25/M40 family metallo-hydrolase [Haladaptatus caseinilyticus]